jgi:uncharacterized integral membrane protein (TIGR00698 family)
MRTFSFWGLFPGLVLVIGVSMLAQIIGAQWPLMGSAVAGILLGLMIRTCFQIFESTIPGVEFASNHLLKWSIVVLGVGLPIHQVLTVGLSSLSVTLVTLLAAFLCAVVLGRLLKIPTKLCVLIGGGTAICGASAIAAMAPVIKPRHHETVFSLSTIFLFNIVAVLVFPPIGHLLGLTDKGFGIWAGTAINDTSSVVAAAYSWSKTAGDDATIVKLSRAMMIVPVTAILALVSRRHEKTSDFNVVKSTPWFIVCFVVVSIANGFFSDSFKKLAQPTTSWMITAALTAIGLSTDVSKMKSVGWRPLFLGFSVWMVVACTSLMMQSWKGWW